MKLPHYRSKISSNIVIGFTIVLAISLWAGTTALLRLGKALTVMKSANTMLIQEQKTAFDILLQTLKMNAIAHTVIMKKNEADLLRFETEGAILRNLVLFDNTGILASVREYLVHELCYAVDTYCSIFFAPAIDFSQTSEQLIYLEKADDLSNKIIQTTKEVLDSIRYDFYLQNIEAQKLLIKTYNGLFPVMILIIAVFCFLVIRINIAISIPLKKIIESAQLIAQGNFENKLDIQTDNELSDLANAFNSMTEQLKVAMEDLEHKVYERTQKLNETITQLGNAWKTSDSLRKTSQLLSSTLDLQEVLNRILESVGTVVSYDTASIMLVDDNFFEMKAVRGFKAPERLLGNRYKFEELPINHGIILSREPLIISDTYADPRWKKLPETEQIHSWLGVPFFTGDRIVGIMAVDSYETNHFNESHIPLVTTFAHQASIALRNAQLYEQTKLRAQQLAALNDLSRAISGELNKYNIMKNLCTELCKVMKVDTLHGSIYNKETNILSFLIWYESGFYHSFESGPLDQFPWSEKVINSQKPLIVLRTEAELKTELDIRKSMPFSNRPSASMLFVPIIYGDTVLGILSVQSYEFNAYSQDDLVFLENIARQTAIALRNADLFEEMHDALKKANEANKLKSQFLANMSHELRTPLNSIINFAYLLNLETEGPVTPGQSEMLKRMEDAGRHLLELINNVLDLSKIESGKLELNFELTQLSEIILEAVSVSSGLVKDKPIDIRAILPEQIPLIAADKTRIRQVMLNLISNAVKFTERGSISVKAQTDVTYSSVTVIVEDTGIGIAKEDIPKIFLEFVQLDGELTRKAGGTGLGLPISKHFIEMHGGSLYAESEPGKGTRLVFTLPSFIGPLADSDSAPK